MSPNNGSLLCACAIAGESPWRHKPVWQHDSGHGEGGGVTEGLHIQVHAIPPPPIHNKTTPHFQCPTRHATGSDLQVATYPTRGIQSRFASAGLVLLAGGFWESQTVARKEAGPSAENCAKGQRLQESGRRPDRAELFTGD